MCRALRSVSSPRVSKDKLRERQARNGYATGPSLRSGFRRGAREILMNDAKDKLIVALDVDQPGRALELYESLRDCVDTFKIGMQLFTATGPEMVRQIVSRG